MNVVSLTYEIYIQTWFDILFQFYEFDKITLTFLLKRDVLD